MCIDNLDEIIKKSPWPFAAVVACITIGFAAPSIVGTHEKNQIKKVIVQACADKPDIKKCASDLKDAVNDVNP